MSEISYQRTCTVCDEALPLEKFPSQIIESKCTHDIHTCSKCWKQWLQVQVATKTFDKIQCAQCDVMLGQQEIKSLATEEAYQRYRAVHFVAIKRSI